jgi:ATP-dependent RNA helicase RhlE
MSFRQFQLQPPIESAVRGIGYTAPTPIQLQSIPLLLQGKDLMGIAQTGTGKTAAFVLPILHRLMAGPRKRLRALILAPTRELAEQIHEAVGELGRETALKSAAVYGGVSKTAQIRKLREGAEIVAACPGRLLDLADEGAIRFSDLDILIIDEADRMLDMGFIPDVRKIVKRLPVRRQTALFSATMPRDIQELAKAILREPVVVRVGGGAPVSTVAHAVYPVEPHLKTPLLMKLIEETDTESVLVFARTKHRTTSVARKMKSAGFAVVSLQGNLSQGRRQEAIEGFRCGRYRILVATDIAARGIDIARISHVINYDMPDTVEAYTHRIGRTGRAEKSGEAFSLATPQDWSFLSGIESLLGEKIERRTLEGFDYTVPAPAGSGPSSPAPSCRRCGSPVRAVRRYPESRGSQPPRPRPGVKGARTPGDPWMDFPGRSRHRRRNRGPAAGLAGPSVLPPRRKARAGAAWSRAGSPRPKGRRKAAADATTLCIFQPSSGRRRHEHLCRESVVQRHGRRFAAGFCGLRTGRIRIHHQGPIHRPLERVRLCRDAGEGRGPGSHRGDERQDDG